MSIYTIKDYFCAICSSPPFKRLTTCMVIELMSFCIMWLNAFPLISGIWADFSTKTIMTETKLDYNKLCYLPFGIYTKAHGNPLQTNVDMTWTYPCLGTSWKIQGNYKFLNLNTSHIIKWKQWRVFPAKETIINHAEALAHWDWQPCDMVFT